jgi:hypothetical protein
VIVSDSHARIAWPADARPVERVLELSPPRLSAATARAEAALHEALEGVASSCWPEVAWRFSAINGDGFPVEFTFSSATPCLRYTAEVAGPEWPERDRFRAAARWAGCPEERTAIHARRSQPGPLRWGAWVGGFHPETGCRRKIYLEAGRGSEPPSDLLLPAGASLRLIGLAQTGAGLDCELYFRRDHLETADIGRILYGLRLRECFAPLCESVADTLPWPIHHELVPTDAGFSTAGTRAFSVFTYARSVWGSDGSIRRNVLDLAMRHGWDFELYEQVTRPLEESRGYLTSHGVLAWIVAPNRAAELRISVRPPNGAH